MGDRPDGFETIERMRAEAGNVPAVAEFLRSIDRWVEDGSARPLEAYLALPTTAARRRRYRRDKWLTRAASELDASGWAGCVKLAAEIDRFVCRGPWLAWRDELAPPIGTARLREALFWVARFNDGDSLDATTLLRMPHVLRAFPEAHSSIAPTIIESDNKETRDAS